MVVPFFKTNYYASKYTNYRRPWEFKLELLDEIKKILSKQGSGKIQKYLKSSDVMDHLQVSPGTLQNLRIMERCRHTQNWAE